MRFLLEFSKYTSDEKKVEEYLKDIQSEFKVETDKDGNKYVMFDEKQNFIQGNKSVLRSRLFNHFDKEDIHKPSLKKAIKIWLDKNS